MPSQIAPASLEPVECRQRIHSGAYDRYSVRSNGFNV